MDPDSFEKLISCRVCYDIFNEGNRRPRILNCGHSFCHSCLENLLLSRSFCPVCKAEIKFTSVAGIPVNFIVKDLISAIGISVKDGDKFKICKSSKTSNDKKNKFKKRLESLYLRSKRFETHRNREKKFPSDLQNSSMPKRQQKRIKSYYSRKKKSSESSQSALVSRQVKHAVAYCANHKNKCTFRCLDCEKWICDICLTNSNHSSCNTLSVEDYSDMKKRMFQKIEKHLVANTKLSEKIKKSLNILNIKNKSLIIEINNRQLKFKNNSNRIKELETKNSEKVEVFEKLKCLRTLVENSVSDEELWKAKFEVERAIDSQKNHASSNLQRISHFKLQFEKQQSLLTVCKTETVYVVEGSLYGKVNVRKETFWISSFSATKPTAKMISFRRLLHTLTGTTDLPTKVFLQLIPLSNSTTAPNVRGTDISFLDIVIGTIKSSSTATDFVLSCAGLKKHQSCKGKTLIYSSSSYALNSELSSDAVGCNTCDNQSSSCSIGQVFGTGNFESGFRIALEPLKYQFEFPLGTVSSGFQNLKTLRRNTLVKDCGFSI